MGLIEQVLGEHRSRQPRPGNRMASRWDLRISYGDRLDDRQCRVGRFLASLEEMGLISLDDAIGVSVVTILKPQPDAF